MTQHTRMDKDGRTCARIYRIIPLLVPPAIPRNASASRRITSEIPVGYKGHAGDRANDHRPISGHPMVLRS